MEERLINLKVFDANWLCRYLDWFRNGITLQQYCRNSVEKYGCYMTPELFEELRNATSLLEQIDLWCDISEDRRTSPEIDFAQFQKNTDFSSPIIPTSLIDGNCSIV